MVSVLTQNERMIINCQIAEIIDIKKERAKPSFKHPKENGFCIYGGTYARRCHLGWYETEERAKAVLREMFMAAKYEMPKD